MHKPAKARVTGPASLSCISKSSMLAVGSLLVVSKGGSSRLEEVAVLRPLSWRLVESTEVTGGFVIKIMAGVLKNKKTTNYYNYMYVFFSKYLKNSVSFDFLL